MLFEKVTKEHIFQGIKIRKKKGCQKVLVHLQRMI
jgi:hypothetical protein